jgi:hypothetical protein
LGFVEFGVGWVMPVDPPRVPCAAAAPQHAKNPSAAQSAFAWKIRFIVTSINWFLQASSGRKWPNSPGVCSVKTSPAANAAGQDSYFWMQQRQQEI